MNRAYSRAGIISRLFNTPLAVTSQTAAIVLGALGERLDISQLTMPVEGQRFSQRDLGELAEDARIEIQSRSNTDRRARSVPADKLMMVHEGVAHIDVRGELVAENGIGPVSGFTGYDGIAACVESADADPNVRGILLDIDSPGGEVAGLYECTAILMARRGTKPLRAMIRGSGCSAAYALAACADEITLHDLGYAGSIGTIAMHADFSQALEQDGVKVTLFTAGAHKADGNPFEPLPESVANDIQAMVEIANSRFIAHVASARAMSEDDVRSQQAQIYRGEAAIKAGLVDSVMSWRDSMDEFAAAVNQRDNPAKNAPSGARSAGKGTSMSTEANAPAANSQPEFTQADLDAARAEGVTEGQTAGAETERNRITALAELDEGSTLSASLTGAIAEGTNPGDYAISLAKDAKSKREGAAAAARGDAVSSTDLPEGGGNADPAAPKGNRGQAAVDRMRGKHPGLPKS